MEEVLKAIEGNNPLSAIKIIIKELGEAGIINSAILFYGDPMRTHVLFGKRAELKNLKKDLIEKALTEKKPFCEKKSLSCEISSIYIHPIFQRESLLGFLYIERAKDRRKFSDGEILLLRFLGEISSIYLKRYEKDLELKKIVKDGWMGSSPFSQWIRENIKRFSRYSKVLITGETGVGKSFLAELIHKASERKGEFVVVSCPSIPDSLFESELFGHKKGAFTSALTESIGLIGEADGGTLFLDDISELPLSLQAKFLRFAESKVYRRIGETKERRSECGIICATNRDLKEEMMKGRFRKDLYFRISTYTIHIPPLRERKEDIENIARSIFEKKGFSLKDSALRILREYDYPGNVRELENIIEKVVETREGNCEIEEKETKRAMSLRGFFSEKENISASHRKEKIMNCMERMRKGESFWRVVKERFITRELSKEDVKEIVLEGLKETVGKSYRELCHLFHIHENEYKKFVSFLHRHNIIH